MKENRIILDVRTPKEYAKLHIPGAMNIPYDTIDADIVSVLPDKSAGIAVYCKSGLRSKDAAARLSALGYTDVENLGSIDDWQGYLESIPNP
ncbi:MAG: rhodanese-like domain-containing protein [Ruminococcaceae bacterium]|nr:rhodanese-like domain-containing protein [Oscillospiraceae bacterium]